MIIALLAEKGGTGKTTLATNLAGMRGCRGTPRVLLVDADRQGSSRFWARTRSSSETAAAGLAAAVRRGVRQADSDHRFTVRRRCHRHRRGRRLRDGHRSQGSGLRSRSASAHRRGRVDSGTGGRPRGRGACPQPRPESLGALQPRSHQPAQHRDEAEARIPPWRAAWR